MDVDFRWPTKSEMKLLRTLELGPIRQVAMAQAAGLSTRGTGSWSRRLLKLGYIKKVTPPLLALTEQGMKVLTLWHEIEVANGRNSH